MARITKFFIVALLMTFTIGGLARAAYAKQLNVDAVIFRPATDGGRYLNLYDAQTLLPWRFHAGIYFDYGHEPLEVRNVTTSARTGVVDDLSMANIQGALGFVDWFQAGVGVPVVLYESYRDPDSTLPKQSHAGLGDIRLDTKFRILDNYRFPVGVALVPFMTFPTGKSQYFLGYGRVTSGINAAVEANIQNRVWIAMNWGYQYIPGSRQYYSRNLDAVIDDLLIFGVSANGKINDMWSLLAELYGETVAKNAFQSLRQTPVIAHGAVSFMPRFKGAVRGLAFTVGAGGGLTKGVGNPDFHVLAGVNFHKPRIVELGEPSGEAEARLEEKIIITQMIHFEFNKAIIRPISYPILDDVVDLLKMNTHIGRVQIEGHTDWIGSDAYNQRLSERRAMAVVEYFVQHGISRDRLTAVGYGELRPIADNRTTEGRAKNRRTEFTVLQAD